MIFLGQDHRDAKLVVFDQPGSFSILIVDVQIGVPRLISVSDEDTTKLSSIRASILIGSKAMNSQQVLVFARDCPEYRID